MKLSVILVHYKAKAELFACLKSLLETVIDFEYEVIVVDNDETKNK